MRATAPHADPRSMARLEPLLALVVAALSLVTAGPAAAAGGKAFFDGGTPREHGQVRAALDASAFDVDPASDNAYKPTSASDESAAMAPAPFRALLGSLLGFADPLAAKRSGSRCLRR